MIGARAIGDQRIVARPRFGLRAPDQLLRFGPTEPHAALRRIHRFGDAEPEIPQPVPEGEGALPVDGGRQPRIIVGQWIGHHMRRRIGDAGELAGPVPVEGQGRPRQRVGGDRTIGIGEIDFGHLQSSS